MILVRAQTLARLERISVRHRDTLFADPWRQALARDGVAVRLARREFAAALAVFGRRGLVSYAELIDAVYGEDEDGGPENARGCLSVARLWINRDCAPLGLEIQTRVCRGYEGTVLPLAHRRAA